MTTPYTAQDYHDRHVAKVRAAIRDDAEACPYCIDHKAVMPSNWSKHMAVYHPDVLEPLNYDEYRALEAHESVINAGLSMFVAVGKALAAIQHGRLYRAQYLTFEAYLAERWNMSRTRGYQFIDSPVVIENLSTFVDAEHLPQLEAHVRPLVPLAPEEQRIVWEVVQQTAPDGKVTKAHVESVKRVFKEVATTGAIDDGTGASIRVADVMKAAITEETYERMARQAAHITARSKRERVLSTEAVIHKFAYHDDCEMVVLRMPKGTDTAAIHAAYFASKPVFVSAYVDKETTE